MAIPPGSLIAQYDVSNPLSYSGTGNTLYDLTASNFDLTLSNTTYNSTTNYDSLVFDAASLSYANYNGSLGVPTGPPVFTFFMWIKTTSFTANSYNIFFAYGRDGNPSIGGIPLICSRAASSNVAYTEFGSGKAPIAPGTPTVLNQWTNYCITSDGTTYKFYIDGALVGSVALSGGDIWTSPQLTIGDLSTGAGFKCNLEFNYLEAYDSALSAGDITTLYNDTKIRFAVPVASYDFSDPACYPGSGTTVFDLEGSLDLPISGATFVSDGNSSYFSFDGSNDYIGKNGVTGFGNTFTLSIWSQSNGSTADCAFCAGTGLPASNAPAIGYNQATVGNINASFNWGTGLLEEPFTQNVWQNIVYTADGTNVKLYVDGTLQGTTTQGVGTWPTGGFYLGISVDASGGVGGDPLQGKIALLDIYNVALGSTYVANVYAANSPRFDNLVAAYDFSDPLCYPGSGSTVFDLSGSEIDLPIVNATFGGTGQSKYFDFNGSNALIGKNGVTGLGNTFSVNMWSKYPSSATTQMYQFSAGTYSAAQGAGPQSSINNPSTNFVDIAFNDGIGTTSYATTPDVWHNYTFTADGTTVKGYLDGVLAASVSQGVGSWDTGGLYLGVPISTGGNYYPGLYFDGQIAIAEFYNTALSAGEITDIYDNEVSRFGSPPPAYQGIVGGRQFAQGFNG